MCELNQRCLHLVQINVRVCIAPLALEHFRPSFLLFAGSFPTASSLRPKWLSRCMCLCFPGHLGHILNYVSVIQEDLGHLMCRVILQDYIPEPGFQHLKSIEPR